MKNPKFTIHTLGEGADISDSSPISDEGYELQMVDQCSFMIFSRRTPKKLVTEFPNYH